MRLLISFAALLLSVVLLQLSSGGLGPLNALSGLKLGFTKSEIGLLGSAHFVGFFIGCWWSPRLMGAVGHSRAFAVFTAMGAIGLLAHMLWINPTAWAAMRIASGLCVAGAYTVIEAWMNAKITNKTRGRAMGGLPRGRYGRVFGGPAFDRCFNTSPLCQLQSTRADLLCRNPALDHDPRQSTLRPYITYIPTAPRLRPGLAWTRSPLAVAGCVVAGITSAAFRMVGPIYGQDSGLGHRAAGLVPRRICTGWSTRTTTNRMDRRQIRPALGADIVVSGRDV